MTNQMPRLRFEGFTSAWEQRKLGEISDSFSGGTPTAGKKEYYGGTIPFIRSAEINLESTELFLTSQGFKSSSARMVEKGDILYALYGATSGEVGISQIDGAINQAILAIKPTQGDDSYLIVQWLKKQKETIISTYLQGGQGNLSGAIVKNLTLTLPNNESEQQKLGQFFHTLDTLIAFHQRKLDLMKRMKKGLLQRIFGQELRFDGFDDKWEFHQFGDHVDKIKSYSLSRDIESSDTTEYQYIHYGDIHTKVADIIDKNTALPYIKGESYELLQQNDLIVADASEDYEGIAEPAVIKELADRKIVAGLHTIALRPKEADSVFLYYLLHTRQFKEYGSKAGTGMKVFGISFPNLSKFEAMIPSFEEQKEIGNFFLNMDKQISLQSQKLIQLQSLKKSLLQQMFI